MHYSVCIPAVLSEWPADRALRTVKDAGFTHYEIWSWWDQDMEAYLAAQRANDLRMAAMCTSFIPLTDPDCRKEYIIGLKETLKQCRTMDCPVVISQVGGLIPGVSRERQHESVVEGLKDCVPYLENEGITLAIEPLNTRIDHPGYYLWSMTEALDITMEVGSAHVKILCDLYHQTVMEDLNLQQILAHLDKIAHFHMAGVPGRHEPFLEDLVPYGTILPALRSAGYTGCLGLEYFPLNHAQDGLKKLCSKLHSVMRQPITGLS